MADAADADNDPLDDLLERERAIARIERLQTVLREALDEWESLTISMPWYKKRHKKQMDRIAELRAQFLDDA